jgi:hypothetical protein
MRQNHAIKKTPALVDFMRWPVSQRLEFIRLEMPNIARFIKEALLRA